MYADHLWAWIVAGVAAYLLGSLSGAIIGSRVAHKTDIRKYGSGNAGVTNTLRTFGWKAAIFVGVIDMGKALLALLLGRYLLGDMGVIVGGGCVALGHAFPLYYGFKGGKCVMSSAIILLFVDWRVFIVCIGLFAILAVSTKVVAIGSLAAAALAPFATWFFLPDNKPYIVFTACMAVFVIFLHRKNIQRLLRGEELKAAKTKEASK